jgi:hypothetical protein
MTSLFKGAIAGALATIPMTLFMRAAHRALPQNQKSPLPPEQITAKAARSVGLTARPHAPGWEWKTYVGHFSYGAAVGAVYSLFLQKSPSKTSETVSRGCIFGLAIWAVSYLGWLPACGVLQPATRDTTPRNGLMIVAHLIWGCATALLVESRQKSRPDTRFPLVATRPGAAKPVL